MARGTPNTAPNANKDEHVQVLNSNTTPREIDLSPMNGRLDAVPDPSIPVDRSTIDPMQVAPVVRDATEPPVLRAGFGLATSPIMKGTSEAETPKVRVYRVEKDAAIVDRTSGARTKLREGKEISESHYQIRDLQRQGVKLRDITDIDPTAPL